MNLAQGPLAAGPYSWQAHYDGDSNYLASTSSCEPFTVDKASTTTATDIKDGSGKDVSAAVHQLVPLGTSTYDTATVVQQVATFVIGGTVIYSFYTNGACTGTASSTQSVTMSGTGSVPNSDTKTLAAGNYTYSATYSGDSNYLGSTGSCEPLNVNKATTTTTTQLTSSSTMVGGSSVTDAATLGGLVNGFTVTGTVTYKVYTTSDCSGSAVFTSTKTISGGVVPSSDPFAPTLPGLYQWQASYSGDGNYFSSKSACGTESLAVGAGFVTDSSFCSFDIDSSTTGSQFKLIFVQDPSSSSVYRLVASNPGQFYYNVFAAGTPGSPVTVTINIPAPFVTQGAVPVHVYSGFTSSGSICFTQVNDISSGFGVSPKTLSGISGGTFTVTGTIPASGLVYVTVHLDFGYKGTSGWSNPASTSNAACTISVTSSYPLCSPNGTPINNLSSYTFSSSSGGTQTVQNENVFKRDPGFAGIILDKYGTPVAGLTVNIYDPKGKLLATVTTDQNGFYNYQYKYTGSPSTFTVKVPAYNLSKAVTLQSNKLVEVDFQLT